VFPPCVIVTAPLTKLLNPAPVKRLNSVPESIPFAALSVKVAPAVVAPCVMVTAPFTKAAALPRLTPKPVVLESMVISPFSSSLQSM